MSRTRRRCLTAALCLVITAGAACTGTSSPEDARAPDASIPDLESADLSAADAVANDLVPADVGKPDSSCLKPGAIPGPTCSTKKDCEAASYTPCFQKCMGCGCVCYAARCYNLLEYNCKP